MNASTRTAYIKFIETHVSVTSNELPLLSIGRLIKLFVCLLTVAIKSKNGQTTA